MVSKLVFRLTVTSFLLPFIVKSQHWEAGLSTKFHDIPSSVSIDTESSIYIGFNDGSLVKYSESGQKSPVFSLPNRSAISLIEAINNRKIFLLYSDIQQIAILDRFSAIPKEYPLRDFGIYFAISACPAPDGTFWVTENNPQRLRKIDPRRRVTVHEVQSDLGDSIKFMRTIQNLLLVADENGLQVIDQFGNLTGSVELKGISYVQLLGDKTFISHEGWITVFDPFESTIDESIEVPFANVRAILKLKENYVVIDNNSLTFYKLKSPKRE